MAENTAVLSTTTTFGNLPYNTAKKIIDALSWAKLPVELTNDMDVTHSHNTYLVQIASNISITLVIT